LNLIALRYRSRGLFPKFGFPGERRLVRQVGRRAYQEKQRRFVPPIEQESLGPVEDHAVVDAPVVLEIAVAVGVESSSESKPHISRSCLEPAKVKLHEEMATER